MDAKYFITNNHELTAQTNLPSFFTFNTNFCKFPSEGCFPDELFRYQRTDINQRNCIKDDEDDSGIQYSLQSDSSISTPDIINSIQSSTPGLDNLSPKENFEQITDFWLKVNFMSPSSFFYKDIDKPSNAVKLTYLPNRESPLLYVEKGRVIEIAIETNFRPTNNSILKFDIYTVKGTREEPVYGISNEINYNSTSSSNLCFIQATEEQKVSAYYIKSDNGFISMIVPVVQSSWSFSVVFPFLNFKCQSSSKKVVFLKISICDGQNVITWQKFQLVSCTSPNRDFKRHFEKLNNNECDKHVPKKMKLNLEKEIKEKTEISSGSSCPSISNNPQYVIMTENYDIWKILNIVHQQLNEHFSSIKK